MKFFLSVGLFTNCALSTAALAESPQSLDQTTVIADREDKVINKEKALKQIARTPGSSSIISTEDWVGNGIQLADIFELNPSVTAEETGVANDTRITIRGSAAQSQRMYRGISVQQDGIPFGSVDGAFLNKLIEPLTVQSTLVHPGANGFAYGASQFGGAINYQVKNGLSNPGGFLQADYGSYDTIRATLQYGEQTESVDYFGAYTHQQSDGYRDHSAWESDSFVGNIGYAWSDKASTRLYFNAVDFKSEIPGLLTEAQYKDDPKQRQAGLDDSTQRGASAYRIAQQTSWVTEDTEVQFYSYIQTLANESSMLIAPRQSNDTSLDLDEFGLGFRAQHDWSFRGLDNQVKSALGVDSGRNVLKGSRGTSEINQLDKAGSLNIYAENTTSVSDKHHVTLGLGWIAARRDHSDNRDPSGLRPRERLNDYKENQNGGIWRIGYLYNLNSDTEIFANISKSFEAAPFSVIDNSSELQENVDILSPQQSLSYEIGSRFKYKWLKGSLTAYRTEIDGEFVSFELPPPARPNIYQFTNENTIHQGVEALVKVDLVKALDLDSVHRLSIDTKYQLNDFSFDGGASDGNQMPGIPAHIYTSRLQLAAADRKWSASLSARYIPEGLVGDNNNTISTAGFAVWKLSGNYRVNDNLSFYGGVDNLFDKEYISRVAINPRPGPPMDPSSITFVTPGNARTAYIGAKLNW